MVLRQSAVITTQSV